jgi:hypothetical protein
MSISLSSMNFLVCNGDAVRIVTGRKWTFNEVTFKLWSLNVDRLCNLLECSLWKDLPQWQILQTVENTYKMALFMNYRNNSVALSPQANYTDGRQAAVARSVGELP